MCCGVVVVVNLVMVVDVSSACAIGACMHRFARYRHILSDRLPQGGCCIALACDWSYLPQALIAFHTQASSSSSFDFALGSPSEGSDVEFQGLAEIGNAAPNAASEGSKSFLDVFNAKCIMRNKDQVVSQSSLGQEGPTLETRKALPDLRKWQDVAILRTAFDFANHGKAPQQHTPNVAHLPASEAKSRKIDQRSKRSIQQGVHSSTRGAIVV